MNKNRMNLRMFQDDVNIIDRTGAESLIPTQEAKEIIQGTIAQSAVLSRGRKLANMTTDVVGYAPSNDYEFDRYTNDLVQQKIAEITDDELLGSDAQVSIVVVDLFDIKADTPNTCVARKRDWSVVPDNSGDGTDALIYKGSLKANGEKIKGTATTTDNWQTCTFAAD